MSRDAALRRLQRLVEELASDDAFERRDAIESLAVLTQQRLGYDWAAADADRARGVKRWRKWLENEAERRQTQEVQTTIQLLAEGQVDPAVLQKLLKTLPAEQKKALLAQLVVAKAASETQKAAPHAACERCAKRPVTVRITIRRDDGTYEQESLCEVCAGRAED